MDARSRRAREASRAHTLEGRRLRRAQRARGLLALGGSLALSLVAQAATHVSQGERGRYDGVLAACRARDAYEVSESLRAVVEGLDARTSKLGDFDLQARFAAELSLCVLDGEAGDPAVAEEAMAAIPSAGVRTITTVELANAHTASGRLADAEAVLRFGLEHAPEPTTVPRLWYARAEVARLRGNWEFVETCLASMERSIPPDSSYEGDPEKAPYLRENHEYRSRLCQARAQALLSLGLLDQCGPLVREAIDEAKKSGDPGTLVAVNLLAFDRALLSGSAAEEALALVEENLKDEHLSYWHPLLRVAEGIARVGEARDARYRGEDVEAPAAKARAALSAALVPGLPLAERLKVENGLCDLELVVGRPADARTHLERARKLVGELSPSGGPAKESVSLAMLAWRLANQAGTKAEERTRCREQLLDAYGRFLAEWKTTPRRAGGIGFLQVDWRTQLLSDVIDAELSATPGPEGVRLAFERLLEAQAMGTEAREHELSPVGLVEVRSTLLAEGRGLLVLLPARDFAHVFAVDQKTIVHATIPVDRYGLRARALEITTELQNPHGKVVADKLHALHDELLPPDVLERVAGWTSAITVGFDMLRDLPFGVLAGKDGRPYAQRLALCSLPSVMLGVELAGRGQRLPSGGKDVVLVVANDPPKELSLPAFQFGEAERERLLDPFHGRALLLEKKDASRSALLARKGELAGASVLHFLMHGTALPGREFSSALVLSGLAAAPECFFTAEDVAQLELKGGLVILSACGSGRGPARTGDDRLVHLGGAFLDAGAGCVVLARFPVDYEATLALMQRLHERLVAGDSPAEALRAARAEGASADGLAAYHAAAFEILGLGFEPLFGR